MSPNPTRIRALLATAALALSTQAHALVEAGHWQASFSNGAFSVAVDQTPDGNYTGVFMNYTTKGVLSGITYNVDEGADIFVVQPGTVFSNASIASQQLPFIEGPSSYPGTYPKATVIVGQDFYLGARTRSTGDPGFYDAVAAGTLQDFFTTFGWAHFQVDTATGTLKLIDSAMAFREGGIVVGTLQTVPEPSTMAMTGLGLLGLACATRARRRTTTRT